MQDLGFGFIGKLLRHPSLYFVSLVTTESGISLDSTVHVLVDVVVNPGMKTMRAFKTKDIGSYEQIISRVRRSLPKNIIYWTLFALLFLETSDGFIKYIRGLFRQRR